MVDLLQLIRKRYLMTCCDLPFMPTSASAYFRNPGPGSPKDNLVGSCDIPAGLDTISNDIGSHASTDLAIVP